MEYGVKISRVQKLGEPVFAVKLWKAFHAFPLLAQSSQSLSVKIFTVDDFPYPPHFDGITRE